jgi:hypothetical protein
MKTKILISLIFSTLITWNGNSQVSKNLSLNGNGKTVISPCVQAGTGNSARAENQSYSIDGTFHVDQGLISRFIRCLSLPDSSYLDLQSNIAMNESSGINYLWLSKNISSNNHISSDHNLLSILNTSVYYSPDMKYYELMNRSPWLFDKRYLNDTFWSTLLRELYLTANHRY